MTDQLQSTRVIGFDVFHVLNDTAVTIIRGDEHRLIQLFTQVKADKRKDVWMFQGTPQPHFADQPLKDRYTVSGVPIFRYHHIRRQPSDPSFRSLIEVV